jgi:dipeptidyl aminopeptidase/acylaminoacyl peptidase
MLLVGALALALARGGSARAQGATPVPTPTAVSAPETAPAHPPDGAIERLTPLHITPRSAYYALTYWSDGLRVTGYLGRPTSPGPHPAIIHNRGGYDGVGALTGIEIVPWVEAGYVAVASQYRGNAGGEGREDFGGADVHDVTALIPLLRGLPFVDGERIGMFGGSRGGMMTFLAIKAQALAGDDAIKAAVTVGAISDLVRWDRERGGTLAAELWRPLVGATPAEAPALFAARSAIHWPELLTVPLLLLHGQADREVSPQQTRLLAAALGEAGAPVEAIFYPDGDHALTNQHGGVPDALAWFARHLGGDGVDRSFAAHEEAIAAVSTWFLARAR